MSFMIIICFKFSEYFYVLPFLLQSGPGHKLLMQSVKGQVSLKTLAHNKLHSIIRFLQGHFGHFCLTTFGSNSRGE